MAGNRQRRINNRMKSTFTNSWNRSKQARKQRKYRANAPLHARGKFLNAQLSESLAEKHGVKRVRVRSGDEVLIMRGQFKGVSGVVESVDSKKERIVVRGAEVVKDDSSKRPFPIAVSNVQITKIKEDMKRFKNNG